MSDIHLLPDSMYNFINKNPMVIFESKNLSKFNLTRDTELKHDLDDLVGEIIQNEKFDAEGFAILQKNLMGMVDG